MEDDDVTAKLDEEIKGLQQGLKDRLKEAEGLGDLGKQVSRSTFSLEEHTSSLEKTSYKVKIMKALEYYKYFIIGFAIIGCILLISFKSG